MNRSFDKPYDHAEMRPPKKEFSLSAEAKEFVPKSQQGDNIPFPAELWPCLGVPQPLNTLGPPGSTPPTPQPPSREFPQNANHPHRPQLNGHSNSSYQKNQYSANNPHHHHHNNHNHNQHHHYPSKQQQHLQKHSVQNRIQRNPQSQQRASQQHSSSHQQTSNESDSLGGNSSQQYQQYEMNGGANNEGSRSTKEEMHALNLLVEVIKKLINDPGMFETYQREVAAAYREFANNTYVMCNAIEFIFVQSINEANFRYPGARLCRLLDTLDSTQGSVFRYLLNYKLTNLYEENIGFMGNEAQKVRGTTLFLAELYIQLQQGTGRIMDLASSISNTIYLLLEKPTPENIKCICQTLKLCGYELELDFPTETKDILGRLDGVQVDNSTNRLIKSVLDLSGNRWGRGNEPVALPMPVSDNAVHVFNNDPVFYGPDGEILTEEESTFLSDYDNFDEIENGEADPNDLYEPEPEMDLEIQMAFKEFVFGCQSPN